MIDEAEKDTADVVAELNKPCLPDWFESHENLLFWLREFGRIGLPLSRIELIISCRMAKLDAQKAMLGLSLSGSDYYDAYYAGRSEAEFELMYTAHMRACAADSDANDAAELLMKIRTTLAVENEIKERFG